SSTLDHLAWRRRRRRSPPKQGRRPWTAGTRPPPRPPTAAHPERSLARLGPARCAGPAPAGHDRGRGARAPARAAGQPELNGKEATCRDFNADSGRWTVRLDSGEDVALKVANMEPCRTRRRSCPETPPAST
ncbi:unnamed protein product, partial [Prorocentrum cordatum]